MKFLRNKKEILLLGIPAIVAILLYSPYLFQGLLSIDDNATLNVPQLQSPIDRHLLVTLLTPGNHIDFNPLRDLSYRLDFALWGNDFGHFRIQQLVIFISLFFCLYFSAKHLTGRAWVSFLFSTLWLFNAAHIQSVLWLSSRKELLAIFFVVLAFLFFLRACRTERGSRYAMLSFLAFGCSLLSKASFMALPYVGLIGIALRLPLFKIPQIRTLVLATATLGTLVAGTQFWFYHEVLFTEFPMTVSYRLQASIVAFGKEALGWVFPSFNIMDPENWGEWLSLNKVFLLPGALALGGIAVATVWTFYRKNYAFFLALTTFWSIYLPTSGILFPHRNFYAVDYFESPMIALFFCALFYLQDKTKILPGLTRNQKIGALVALPIAFLLITASDLKNYSSPIAVWEKANRDTPDSISLRTQLLMEKINFFRNQKGQVDRFPLEVQNLFLEIDKKCSLQPSDSCLSYYALAFEFLIHKIQSNQVSRYISHYERVVQETGITSRKLQQLKVKQALNRDNVTDKLYDETRAILQYTVTPGERSLVWALTCLTKGNKTAQQLYAHYLRRHLIQPDDFTAYWKHYSAPSMHTKLQSCYLGGSRG